MRQVSLSEMESLLVRYKGRYTAVVGFQPTGWAQGGGGRGSNPGQPSRSSSSVRPSKRLQRGTVVLYKVGGSSIICLHPAGFMISGLPCTVTFDFVTQGYSLCMRN